MECLEQAVSITAYGLNSVTGTRDITLLGAVGTDMRLGKPSDLFPLSNPDGTMASPLVVCLDAEAEANPVRRLRALLVPALVQVASCLPAGYGSGLVWLELPPAWQDFEEELTDRQQWADELEGAEALLELEWEFRFATKSQSSVLAELTARLAEEAYTCIVYAAVDSLLNLPMLSLLAEARRLMTTSTYDGVIPGEAAACLLLELPEQAAQRTLATLTALAESEEPHAGQGDRQRLRALSGAMERALKQAGLSAAELPVVVTPFGSDTAGMLEWHQVRTALWPVRLVEAQREAMQKGEIEAPQPCDTPEPEHLQPNLCIGELGIAALGVHLVLAIGRFGFRYPPVSHCLVVEAGETPWRGALVLTNPRWPEQQPSQSSSLVIAAGADKPDG